MAQDTGASATEADRAATPSGPSPEVSGIAGIPCAVRLRQKAALFRTHWADDYGTSADLHIADLMDEAANFIDELVATVETHPPYAANTTFAAIWQWLARRDALLAKAGIAAPAEQVSA